MNFPAPACAGRGLASTVEIEEMSLSILLKACLIEGPAFGFAAASATFWLQAASINPPWAAMIRRKRIRPRVMGTTGAPAPDVVQQLRRQSQLNAKAALFSGIGAILQFIAFAVS
jgi:hypothetical protein